METIDDKPPTVEDTESTGKGKKGKTKGGKTGGKFKKTTGSLQVCDLHQCVLYSFNTYHVTQFSCMQ